MQIKKTAHCVKVNQINYLKQILQRFDMTNVKVTKTPLPSGYIPQPNTAAVNPKWRQRFPTSHQIPTISDARNSARHFVCSH